MSMLAMSMLWGHAVGVGIVMMMVVFVAIWLWAWLPHHKRAFDELAKLPLRDLDLHTDGNDR